MKPVPTYELLLWERTLQQIPLPSLVNRIYLSLCSKPLHCNLDNDLIFALLACSSAREPASPQSQQDSVGELSTGACIGTPFCSCLVIRGYASAAAGYVGPAELLLCVHLWLEEVSPVIHHRLKTMVREPATAVTGGFEPPRSLRDRQPDEVTAIYATDRDFY